MLKPLEPGDPEHLGGFELLGRLGEGGQGVVYLGRGTGQDHERDQERVAVKVLRSSADSDVMERLARELDAVHQVQPFVTARVIEASVEGGRRYVVSEFIDGPSLHDRVVSQGPLRDGELQRLAVGTITALTAIHGAGVVHRDFKPANVLLGPDGPRVVDFGIARLTDAATMTSGVIGTPAYLAPEQLAGARATGAVDIFAWGVTMVFAATGRSAFGDDTVPAVMHRIMYEEPDLTGVPLWLYPVVSECLDKDPARRPNARDLLLRLVDPSVRPAPPLPATAATGPPLPASTATSTATSPGAATATSTSTIRPTQARPHRRKPRPKSVLLAGGGLVLAALIAVVVLLLSQNSPSSPPATAGSTGSSSAPSTATSASASAGTGTAAPTIPAAFAGTWGGTATMTMDGASDGVSETSTIAFTFAAGARTVHEVNEGCVNTLTLTGATARALTFSEPQTTLCVAGTVTFTRHGSKLDYRWDNGVAHNTAALVRT